MALITISGFPCSGKSRRATQIKDHLERRLADPYKYIGPSLSVSILSDGTSRSAYNDSASEQEACAALLSALQRQLSGDRIVVVDALNHIKGFRYQMYCAAREAKVRMCTVYVVAPPERCREWNGLRGTSSAYTPETLDHLIQRFEMPSSTVRWDAPLFTVPWTDADVPADDIWRAITFGIVKPPSTGAQAVSRGPTGALLVLESTTTALVAAVLTAQSSAFSPGGNMILDVPTSTPERPLRPRITLPKRFLSLSELQQHKRDFVAMHKPLITSGTTDEDWSQESVSTAFVAYLEANVAL